MASFVNTGLLRTLSPDELPSELHTLRLRFSDDIITHQVLGAIERGSLSTSVFAAWIGVCKSPIVIQQALKQKLSIRIRLLGIKQLKAGLESAHWEKLWDGLGGTAGLLEILSDLSVLEVKSACKAIGRCVRNTDVASKREKVTELFKGLHPNVFPNAVPKTHDLRPLTKFYQALIPSCTAELVDWITGSDQDAKWRYVRERELLEHHSENIGRVAFHSVFEEHLASKKSKDRLGQLSTRYPSVTSSETGFSASMAFALSLLRNVVDTGVKELEDEWVITKLIRPLLRRAVRKRASWTRMQEITSLAMTFLQQHRNATKLLTNGKGDVLHIIASCWSRRSALFETHFIQSLSMVFHDKTCFEDIANLLAGIPKSRRYALLHFCCKEVMGVDLDSSQNLSKARGPLNSCTLDSLEAPQALGLFKRLRNARGDVGLVELGHYSSVLVTTRTRDVHEGDPDIYYLVLLNQNGLYEEAESYAAKVLESRKKIVRTTSNRDARADLAVSAWACANASGSLELLSETVRWAKGFLRDQLTASRLFSTYFDESYRLLSGRTTHNNGALKLEGLRKRVEQANAIMLDLLDIACLALREPFFRPSDWQNTISVFTRVVKERVELSADLQRQMGTSDKELYYALWEDTIATLLRAEKLLSQEDYEKLGAATISGVVDFKSVFPDAGRKTIGKVIGKDTCMFLDNLAKARDCLWQELRPARYPEVLTLPKPFPRGLPVQHILSCWDPNIANLQELAPYIFSRVEAALFVQPEAALKPVQSDKLIQQAIGAFVDNYQYALGAYVPPSCDTSEKKKRFRQVWSHATGPLSERRMSAEEAIRYWRRFVPYYLQQTLSEILPTKERVRWPLLPQSDDPTEVQEWNPLEGKPANIKIDARRLGATTYIDFSTSGEHARLTKPGIKSHYNSPIAQVPAEATTYRSIWGSHPSDSEIQAGALAALLFLDTKYGTTERLLATPFPSPDDVRYPCLYLDEDFLSCDELHVMDAAIYISRYATIIPLPLVHRIAVTLAKRFSTKQPSQVLDDTILTLIEALSESDRPGLAFDLAIEIILEQPNASSWNRILFDNGFLQRLPASDARECISTFAEAIGKKLDAQKLNAKVRKEAGRDKKQDTSIISKSQNGDTPQSNQPFVKITTLKLLAQILHGSTYIGDDAALEILADLSKKVSHTDVRISIFRSLLSKLESNRPELWEHVLSALEPFIDLAGSLNEREPLTEDKWTHFEETMTMPMVQLTTRVAWQEESPILDAVVSHYLTLESEELSDLYLQHIMLPTIHALNQQTARWANLFLRKYGSEDTVDLGPTLPPVPRGVEILEQLLTKGTIMPRRVCPKLLDDYVAYMLFMITPPPSIRALNKALAGDPAVKSRPDVETWLDLYGNGVKPTSLYRFSFHRISEFQSQGHGDNSTFITPQIYQDRWLQIFNALLGAGDPNYGQLIAFVSTLTNPYGRGESWWQEHGRTTINVMLSYVDNIRTRKWEADPHRRPSVLPNTFPWQLSLLTYPLNHLCDGDEDIREQTCKIFAGELAAILSDISNSMYHTKLAQIKDHVCNRRNTYNTPFESNVMLSALYLGDISTTRLSWLTTLELLRVDLAADMMIAAKTFDYVALESRIKDLLKTWKTSENEEVRRTGHRVQRELFATVTE